MTDRIRVAAIDNHDVVREGLSLHLDRYADGIRVVASEEDPAMFLASGVEVDVVLLDLLLRDGTSIDDIPALVATGARVLVYTTEERPVPLRAAVEKGANGVLLKSDPMATVVDAIERAMAGEFCCSGPLAHALLEDPTLVAGLSDRQQQVLRCLDEGLDYRATARVLGVSPQVVKTHLARVREKYRMLGIEPGNSHDLTRRAYEEGYLR